MMTRSILESGNKSQVSVIKDPFNLDCIERILIAYNKGYRDSYWYGNVHFKNGLTEARQETKHCEDFESVVAEVRAILESVNKQQQ